MFSHHARLIKPTNVNISVRCVGTTYERKVDTALPIALFFIDFVVGAPYEESGTGVIYVYHGGKTGPSVEVSQRIVGRQILPGIRGFGISFSRSLDIDANKYTGM